MVRRSASMTWSTALPGEDLWLVGEHRSTAERKYYLSNLPTATPIKQLAGAINANSDDAPPSIPR
jgi:hypothetical protein